MTKMIYAFCVCVFNLLQDIHQFALRQIDVYLSQARPQKNTHHYLLITPYILIQTQPVSHPLFIRFGCLFIFHAMYVQVDVSFFITFLIRGQLSCERSE